jgi:hypothetical protein
MRHETEEGVPHQTERIHKQKLKPHWHEREIDQLQGRPEHAVDHVGAPVHLLGVRPGVAHDQLPGQLLGIYLLHLQQISPK